MTPYSQKDSRWSGHLLGTSKTITIGNDGCVLTSLGMMADLNPNQVNEILVKGDAFQNEVLVIWATAARLLDFAYTNATDRPIKTPCLAWTDFYTPEGFPTHYFVYLGNGKIIDPLNGRTELNPYPIKGYINITPKENVMSKEQLANLMLPDALLFWETHHGKKVAPQDISAIKIQIDKVVAGQLDYTNDCLIPWSRGE